MVDKQERERESEWDSGNNSAQDGLKEKNQKKKI